MVKLNSKTEYMNKYTFHRRKIPDTVQTEYYVHYEGFNRRLDEWVKSDRIKRQQDRDNSRVSTTPINADGKLI